MKSNDKDVPPDEMLLAEALAAAKARRLGWCKGTRFRDWSGRACSWESARMCCAAGALVLSGRNLDPFSPEGLSGVACGNDHDTDWGTMHFDDGESLGWAFRCAMEDA